MMHPTVKIRKRPAHLSKQAGLSLVELMIALVLGLVVISAVVNTYVGSTRSSRFSQGLQQMQENGRYGITTLQRGLRLAGYSPEGDLEPFDIPASSATSVVVRTTALYDCNGKSTIGVDGVAVNTYAHNNANSTITCRGNVGNEAMPIVEGVEAMRLLWGTSTDTDKVPEQYVTYSAGIDPNEVVAV